MSDARITSDADLMQQLLEIRRIALCRYPLLQVQGRLSNERLLALGMIAGIATLACFETRPTHGVMVVEAMSADPGIPGVRPIPIDADHIGICKPASRETTLYRIVRRFVEDELLDSTQLHTRTSA